MDKLSENIDIEILRYVQCLNVTDTFLKKLESDKNLQKKVTKLKNDLYLMERVKDSKMFGSIKKTGSIKIKNSKAENISGFTLLTPITSRSSEDKTKIYYFQNASIIIKDNIASLNIESIKKSLIILQDNIEAVNISSLNEYSTNLGKGKYTILLDDKTMNIEIE